MSFDDHDGPNKMYPIGTTEVCKPDYEAQATKMKKRLDATLELESALFKFKDSVGANSFTAISAFAEFVGGVVIKKSEFTKHYEELLTQIEKEA